MDNRHLFFGTGQNYYCIIGEMIEPFTEGNLLLLL